jgi:hypothetical protein
VTLPAEFAAALASDAEAARFFEALFVLSEERFRDSDRAGQGARDARTPDREDDRKAPGRPEVITHCCALPGV